MDKGKLTLRGLVISFKELNIAGDEDPERFVMEDGLTELLDGLCHYQVQIVNLDMFQADNKEKLQTVLELLRISPKECLMLAATDRTLEMAQELEMASIAYRNPRIPDQKLLSAELLVEGFEEVEYQLLERSYQRKHEIPWTVIETERCILREITMEDLDALYLLYQGESITKYMEGLYEDRKKEEEYTRAYIRNMYRFYGYGMWIAEETFSGKIIGRVGLDHLELDGEVILELGYVIGEQYQHQGYATELCQGVIEFAKNGTGFAKIYCLIEKENKISIHLAEKLGFIWQKEVKIQRKTLQTYVKSLYNVD